MNFERLVDLVRGFQPARVLLTAVELDLFTVLDEKALPLAELARACGASERGMSALVTALAGLGVLERRPDGTFAAAPAAARALSRHSPEWRGSFAFHDNDQWKRWSELTEAVRSGKPASLPRAPQELLAAELALHHLQVGIADAIAAALPLGGKRRILDLGGAPGTIVAALLRRDPGATATIVDLSLALDVAKKVLPKEWVKDGRVKLRAGNLLEDTPPVGFELVLLSDVLRLFDPAEARRVLLRARESLVPGGELAVRDCWLDPERTAPGGAALESVNLLVNTAGGRVHTRAEALGWIAALGLEDPRFGRVEGDADHEILLARRAHA